MIRQRICHDLVYLLDSQGLIIVLDVFTIKFPFHMAKIGEATKYATVLVALVLANFEELEVVGEGRCFHDFGQGVIECVI